MNLQLAQSPQFSVTWHPTQQIGSVSNYSAIRNTPAPLALCSHPASANRLLLSSAYWETMLLPRQQVHPAVGCISLSTYCSKSNLPWFVVDNGGRAQEAGGYHQIYPWRNVLPSWTVCNLPKLLLLLWWNSAHLIRIMLLTRHSFREEEMQKLNRRTNSRMAWLGFLSLAICLSVAGLQLWHLKNFFERKKLLWFILV